MATANEYLNLANEYVGMNGDLFNAYFGWQRGTAWCANFQSYLGEMLHLGWRSSASAAGFASQFQRIDDDMVQPGDMVFFNWDGVQEVAFSEHSHVAVVEWFDHETQYFGVIEGNGNGGICRKTQYYNLANYFTAFFRPAYDQAGKSANVPDVYYRVSLDPEGEEFLPPYTGLVSQYDNDGYAGIIGQPFRYISLVFPGYAEIVTESGHKESKQTNNGVILGNGEPITAIKLYYETENPSVTGWHGVKYRVHVVGGDWLDWMLDDICQGCPCGEDFAGDGTPIDAIMAYVARI